MNYRLQYSTARTIDYSIVKKCITTLKLRLLQHSRNRHDSPTIFSTGSLLLFSMVRRGQKEEALLLTYPMGLPGPQWTSSYNMREKMIIITWYFISFWNLLICWVSYAYHFFFLISIWGQYNLTEAITSLLDRIESYYEKATFAICLYNLASSSTLLGKNSSSKKWLLYQFFFWTKMKYCKDQVKL